MSDLTQAQRDAVEWLRERGGDGVLMYTKTGGRHGAGGAGYALMAAGEVSPSLRLTWDRLVAKGRAELYLVGEGVRLRLR